MRNINKKILNLEQYQCERCKRFFYIDKTDKSVFDLDFGCPYGCDEAGNHIKDIRTEMNEVVI